MSLVERRALPLSSPEPRFVTVDPATVRLLVRVRHAASTDTSVLIEGESGTGKEILAQQIHAGSPRRAGRLISVAGNAFGRETLEQFAHVTSTTSGSAACACARREPLHGSTLLLDEIAELEPTAQSRLVQRIEGQRTNPEGGSTRSPCAFRLVATTRHDLANEVRAGRFRRDLYTELTTFRLRVRPLRERVCDVALLLRHFLDRRARRGIAVPSFGPETLVALARHAWPGNVRELENLVDRLVRTHGASAVEPCNLKLEAHVDRGPNPPSRETSPPPTLRELERWWIHTALVRSAGNRARAARELGISLQTLQTRMQCYAIDTPGGRARGAEEAHERYATA